MVSLKAEKSALSSQQREQVLNFSFGRLIQDYAVAVNANAMQAIF